MISETGYELPRGGGSIKLGDILKSSMTHDVVVMFHENNKVSIVKVIGEDTWFGLKEFIDSWGSNIKIDGNLNIYKE